MIIRDEITTRQAYLWLAMNEVSADKQMKLLERLDSPERIWQEFASGSLRSFFNSEQYAALSQSRTIEYLERVEAQLEGWGIGYVTAADEDFPLGLRQEEVFACPLLFYRGNIELFAMPSFAIVGTRKCTRAGLEQAARFSSAIAEQGYAVVSGMALGVDAAAHEAAFEAKCATIAVLGSGLNKPTPAQNYRIFERLCQHGLVVSEYPPHKEGTKYTYPQRNRIISGLSMGVLVVEAGEGSGALYTAEFAHDQGRNCYAIPGHISSFSYKGSNELIKKGVAKLVTCPEDIILELNASCNSSGRMRKDKKIIQNELDNEQKKIYNLLTQGKESYDELIDGSGFMPSVLNSALIALEMMGIIMRAGKGYKILNEIYSQKE